MPSTPKKACVISLSQQLDDINWEAIDRKNAGLRQYIMKLETVNFFEFTNNCGASFIKTFGFSVGLFICAITYLFPVSNDFR